MPHFANNMGFYGKVSISAAWIATSATVGGYYLAAVTGLAVAGGLTGLAMANRQQREDSMTAANAMATGAMVATSLLAIPFDLSISGPAALMNAARVASVAFSVAGGVTIAAEEAGSLIHRCYRHLTQPAAAAQQRAGEEVAMDVLPAQQEQQQAQLRQVGQVAAAASQHDLRIDHADRFFRNQQANQQRGRL